MKRVPFLFAALLCAAAAVTVASRAPTVAYSQEFDTSSPRALVGKKVIVIVANATPPSNPVYTLKVMTEHWLTVQDADGKLVFFARPHVAGVYEQR